MTVRAVATATVDQAQLAQLLAGAGSPVYDAMERASGRARDYAKLNLTAAGIGDTGQLRNQIESTVTVSGQQVVGRITSHAPHTMYVHEGTAGPIYPRRARALRFTVKGVGDVFAAHVRGTRETGNWTPFLTDALSQLTVADFL